MLVLDQLYVSDEVLDFLEESGEPVLDNDAARSFAAAGRKLNITREPASGSTDPVPSDADSATSSAAIATSRPRRVVALSEMHLEEAKAFCSPSVRRGIELCKDKAACRQALAPLFPDYTFLTFSPDELLSVDPESIAYPVVLKPSTGFFSIGIYPLFSAADWRVAIADIRANSERWSGAYNSTVVNNAAFIVESHIDGQEYAVDAYFDSCGKAVVLDILKHDFAGTDDVSDRLYYTSKRVIQSQLQPMTEFLDACNGIFGLTDFPVHVEVRVQKDGRIIPIEFNPLRFAGLCTTDTAYFAYGFKTYEYFLRDLRPDWDGILAGKDGVCRDGVTYTMILLTKSGFDASKPYTFDYDTVRNRFRHVIELRKADVARLGTFGFLFSETRDKDWDREVEPLLRSDLDEFITRA